MHKHATKKTCTNTKKKEKFNQRKKLENKNRVK